MSTDTTAPLESGVTALRAYSIIGMTCGHCTASVSEELLQVPGVMSVRVSLEPPTAVVRWSTAADLVAARAAVEEAGYELAGEVALDVLDVGL